MNQKRQSIIFAMRYPDDIGYVWKTVAQVRDRAAAVLIGNFNCYIAYPQVSAHPSYHSKYLSPIELDCYDASDPGSQKLEKMLIEKDCAAIVYMSALPSTLNMRLFRKMNILTVNTENDSFDVTKKNSLLIWLTKFTVRRLLKRQIHALHLANAASQFKFLRDYALIPPERIALVRNGVDCDYFAPGNRAQTCRDLGLDPDAFWVISVSQARTEKRMDIVIRSAASVIKKYPKINLKFIYVGDGPCLESWRRLAKDLNLDDHFYFAGEQTNVLPFYQIASLMLHAAERESFGLAIVEAMACGVPVIAASAAGPSETILDGETGTLVEINNQSEFDLALERYLVSSDLCERHGKNGMVRANEFFSIQRQGVEMGTHIRNLLRPEK